MRKRTKLLIFITAVMLFISGVMAWCLWMRSGVLAAVAFFCAYNIATVYIWLPWSIWKRIHRW